MKKVCWTFAWIVLSGSAVIGLAQLSAAPPAKTESVLAKAAPAKNADVKLDLTPKGIGPHDWGQWGGSTLRNNAPEGKNIPTEWTLGSFDKSGKWIKEGSKNVEWVSHLGSQSYGNPVVANGQVYVGSNNGSGYVKRYPATVDLGVLLAFSEADGKFLWQHSNEKLPTGRVHDWPLQGICTRRWWRATDSGTSPVAAKWYAWTRRAFTTTRTTGQ